MSFDFSTSPGEDNSFADALSQQFELVNNIQVKQSTLLFPSIQYEAEKRGKIVSTKANKLLSFLEFMHWDTSM